MRHSPRRGRRARRRDDNANALIDLSKDVTLVSHAANRYRIIRSLGAGGNANVYLVTGIDGSLQGVLAAAKVFRTISLPNRLARFLREIENTRQLKHPSVMQLYDEGRYETEDGAEHPFFVAEYLPTTIQEAASRGLTTLRKVSYITQILSALSHLEALDPQGLHRDIKPDNLFVKGETCVLGDLGLLKFLTDDDDVDEDRTFYVESTGSAFPRYYRSPELVAFATGGPRPSTRSDVFQLGLVAAELFTGNNPINAGENKYAVVVLAPLKDVIGTHFAPQITGLLESMLATKGAATPLASEMLPRWKDLLLEVTRHAMAFDGIAL